MITTAMEHIVDKCTRLEVLKVGTAVQMEGTCFEKLALTNCGGTLRVLDFNNRNIPTAALYKIGEVCSNLITLGMANPPDPVGMWPSSISTRIPHINNYTLHTLRTYHIHTTHYTQ